MKILVISQYYRPDITAAAFRISETVDHLRSHGHDVTVVTSEPHRATASSGSDASPDDDSVYRVLIDPLTGSGIRPYLRHFFSFVFRARRIVRKRIRSGYRPDVIWVTSPPLFVGLVGTYASRRSGAPVVLDIRDVWPDTAVAAGQISSGGRAYRIGRVLERWLYRRADAITCVAEPMAEYIRNEISNRRRHSGGTPVEVVYNGAGFEIGPPVEPESVRSTVLYAGNLGRLQGIDSLLEAWARIAGLDGRATAGWTLELIGGGVLQEELEASAERLGIRGSIVFRGVLPKHETVAAMYTAGVLFLNLIPNPVFDLTIPSKLFDYLATGRPIIGGITGEGREILRRLPGNHVVSPSNTEQIAAALGEAMASPRWNEPIPGNREAVIGRFSRRGNVDNLEALFADLVGDDQ